MTAGRVLVSEPSARDLDKIWDYLAREASPEVADFVIARVYEVIYRAAAQTVWVSEPTAQRPPLHHSTGLEMSALYSDAVIAGIPTAMRVVRSKTIRLLAGFGRKTNFPGFRTRLLRIHRASRTAWA